jgi:chromosome partitioning protein
MATIIGFISEKGGVGKTTACFHIAVALAWYHAKRVLVVDTDYQRGGITCRFLPNLIVNFRQGGQMPGATIWDKFNQLYTGSPLTQTADLLSTDEGVTLLPADPRLSQVSVDKMPVSNNIRENNQRLWEHLSLLRNVLNPLGDQFDYILIDTHPEVSELLRTVIYACDFCVSPVKLDLQSAIGVPSAIEAINAVNDDVDMMQRALGPIQAHPATRFAGSIGMMAREWGGIPKASERAQLRHLRSVGGVFETYVTEGDGLRQAAEGRVVVYNIPGANAEKQAEQFRQLTREFLVRCP